MLKEIAVKLHVYVSTVYREIARNWRARGYDVEHAIRECLRRKERKKGLARSLPT